MAKIQQDFPHHQVFCIHSDIENVHEEINRLREMHRENVIILCDRMLSIGFNDPWLTCAINLKISDPEALLQMAGRLFRQGDFQGIKSFYYDRKADDSKLLKQLGVYSGRESVNAPNSFLQCSLLKQENSQEDAMLIEQQQLTQEYPIMHPIFV